MDVGSVLEKSETMLDVGILLENKLLLVTGEVAIASCWKSHHCWFLEKKRVKGVRLSRLRIKKKCVSPIFFNLVCKL